MPVPVLRVALTGGIATGKSYCLARFRERGARVIDADVLAREAVAPGTPGLAAVRARFGDGVVDRDGRLDRGTLGRIVFADVEARRDLERIVHPVVRAAIDEWYRTLGAPTPDVAGTRTVAIADIPLLYERDRARDFDRVVVAACDATLQRRRLIARDGLTPSEADRRIASQIPIADKRRRADYVIDTSGTLADTDRQVDSVWQALCDHSGQD